MEEKKMLKNYDFKIYKSMICRKMTRATLVKMVILLDNFSSQRNLRSQTQPDPHTDI